MLIAKEFKFILLRGSKFRYRSARLTGLRLEMKLTEDVQIHRFSLPDHLWGRRPGAAAALPHKPDLKENCPEESHYPTKPIPRHLVQSLGSYKEVDWNQPYSGEAHPC
jgi:hypothetical protein